MQPSWIAEFVMRGMLPDAKGRRPSRLKRAAYALTRRILAARGQRFIRYKLGGSEILLPLGHDLPIYIAALPQYSTNIARICRYVFDKYPDLHLIDIGSNVGDTVALVRQFSECPILCIEGDEYYFNLLSENIRRGGFRSVKATRAFVATHSGEIKGKLLSLAGTARFVEDTSNSTCAIKLSDLLRDFPDFQSPKLLKIDTDGFDCSILRSELEWLGKHKPVIFFEYDPNLFRSQPYDGTRIFEDLSIVGYTFAILYDNFGDYLTSVDLQQDRKILADLQEYYVRKQGQQYADVAVFHREDLELAMQVRAKEAAWSLKSTDQQIPVSTNNGSNLAGL